VHAGICDASMWDGFDLPGELLRHQLPAKLDDTFAGEPAALVGNSFGGLLSVDFAARNPELVTRLVLLDAALPDHDSLRRSSCTRSRRNGCWRRATSTRRSS